MMQSRQVTRALLQRATHGLIVLVGVSLAGTLVADDRLADEAANVSAESDRVATEQRQQTASLPRESYTDMIMLTVDKRTLTATLQTWPDEPHRSHVLKEFPIAIGKEDGDKQVEGDNKTPEGIYFAQNHIDGGTLPEKYGYGAIPLDIPTPIDRQQGKTGYGIWLHGVDNEERIGEAKVTEGCVAFHNPDVEKLEFWLKAHQGVVVIADDKSQLNRPQDVAGVRAATQAWMDAWAARQLDDYLAAYDESFRYRGMDKDGFGEYKARVFKAYKKMLVSFDALRIVAHPKYAVAIFNQDFNGDDRFVSEGRKILYWTRADDGQWRIVQEVFENRKFEFMTFSDAELAQLTSPPATSGSGQDKASPSL